MTTSNGYHPPTPVNLKRLAGWLELGLILNQERGTVRAWYLRRRPNIPDVNLPKAEKWGRSGTQFPEDIFSQHGLKPRSLGPLFDAQEVVEWWLDWATRGDKTQLPEALGRLNHTYMQEFGIDINTLEGATNG